MPNSIDRIMLTVFSILGAIAIFVVINMWLTNNVLVAYGFFDKRRILELLLILIAMLAIVFNPKRTHEMARLTRSWPMWVQISIGLFFLWGLVSAGLSNQPKYAFLEVGLFMGLLLTAVLVATIKQSHPKWSDELILTTIFTALGIYCIIDLIVLLEFSLTHGHHLLSQASFTELLFNPFFSNPRFFAEVLVLLLPFVVLPLLKPRTSWFSRSMAWCFGTFIWVLALAQQSRGLYLAVIIGCIFAMVVFRKKAFSYLSKHLICLIAATLIGFLVVKMLGIPFRGFSSWISDGRFNLAMHSLNIIESHPLFGLGPMHYSTSVSMISVSHPHDFLLTFATQWGLVPAIIVLAFVITALVKQTRFSLNHPEPLQFALTLSFIGLIVDGSVSGTFIFPASQLVMVMLAGWMMGNITTTNELKHSMFDKITQVKFHVLAIVVIGLLSWGVYPQVLQLPTIKQNYRNAHPNQPSHPYFWSVGNIKLLTN